MTERDREDERKVGSVACLMSNMIPDIVCFTISQCRLNYLVVAVRGESNVQHVKGLDGANLEGGGGLLDDLGQHVLDGGEVGVHGEVSVAEQCCNVHSVSAMW